MHDEAGLTGVLVGRSGRKPVGVRLLCLLILPRARTAVTGACSVLHPFGSGVSILDSRLPGSTGDSELGTRYVLHARLGRMAAPRCVDGDSGRARPGSAFGLSA